MDHGGRQLCLGVRDRQFARPNSYQLDVLCCLHGPHVTLRLCQLTLVIADLLLVLIAFASQILDALA